MSCVLSMIYDVSSFFTWSFRLLIYSTSIPAPCKPGRRRVWFMTNNKLFLVASWIIDDKWDAAVVYITTNQTYSPTGYLNQVLLCAGGSLLYFSCSYVHFFFFGVRHSNLIRRFTTRIGQNMSQMSTFDRRKCAEQKNVRSRLR